MKQADIEKRIVKISEELQNNIRLTSVLQGHLDEAKHFLKEFLRSEFEENKKKSEEEKVDKQEELQDVKNE